MTFCLILLLNNCFQRFLKDKGILFPIFAPILEKEFAWMDSLELKLCVVIVRLTRSSVMVMNT